MKFCRAAKIRKRSVTLRIREWPSLGQEFDPLFDFVARGDCDDIVSMLS